MTPNQSQLAPPLTPIGEAFELVPGALYECVGHTIDCNGRPAEIPGRYVGPTGRKRKPRAAPAAAPPPIPNTHAGQTAAVAPTLPMAHAPAVSSVLTTPVKAAFPPRPKYRKPRATRGDYRRFHQPRPELKLVYEPMSAAAIWGWVALAAVIVAGLWIANSGGEAEKWRSIHAAAEAVKGR
jgi:hypothetical protein